MRDYIMKKAHLTGYFYTCAMLIALTSYTPGYVSASTITTSNATLTTFDATTGNITFDWDQNSIYEVTGTSVTLYGNNITMPGTGVVGTVYEFVIPNFYDPLPMKKIEISMLGANSGASGYELPGVLDIIGSDSDFINGGPALPVLGSFVSNTISSTLVTEYWEMFPNPDFEIVKLYVPVEFELQNINIATQSTVVPIPASLWLFGSGLLGLAGIVRRKKNGVIHKIQDLHFQTLKV
jgi:hypothetical protein